MYVLLFWPLRGAATLSQMSYGAHGKGISHMMDLVSSRFADNLEKRQCHRSQNIDFFSLSIAVLVSQCHLIIETPILILYSMPSRYSVKFYSLSDGSVSPLTFTECSLSVAIVLSKFSPNLTGII